jgi:hypothetical protein
VRGAASYKGGKSALKPSLLRLAVRQGAHDPQGRICKRIFADRGQITGVQMSQSGSVIGTSGVILGISLDEAKGLLSEENRITSALKPSIPCRGWLFSISILIPQSALPTGTTSCMVFSERGAPAVMIEVASPTDYIAEQTERKLVFLRAEVPFTQESLDPKFQKMTASRLIEQLDRIFPGVASRIVSVFPDPRDSSVNQFHECYPYQTLTDIPNSLRIFSEFAEGSFESGIDGIFIGTREAGPSLGEMSSLLSAIESSAWIAYKNGLLSPFSGK